MGGPPEEAILKEAAIVAMRSLVNIRLVNAVLFTPSPAIAGRLESVPRS